jgi:DNA-directed RNA polymerase specialized sigma24 family protein
LRDEIRSALGFAKPRSRRFIYMYYVQGLELSEVGKLDGITASAVCHALTRSMNHLRKTLDSSRTVSRLA